jgi:hypothetical protein
MSREVTLQGRITEGEQLGGSPAPATEGLYLQTENGKRLELINTSMATQMPTDMLHRQSRPAFEPYLGQTVTISGYQSGGVLWNAAIENPSPHEDDSRWEVLPPEK